MQKSEFKPFSILPFSTTFEEILKDVQKLEQSGYFYGSIRIPITNEYQQRIIEQLIQGFDSND